MIDTHHGWNSSFKPLIIGFILSLILTIAAYFITVEYHLPSRGLAYTVIVLGCVQAIFQLLFFLHVGMESKPRWSLMMFFFMVLVIFVLVGGSIWIMHNLNYNVMVDLGG